MAADKSREGIFL